MRQIINILVIALLMTSCVNEIISFDPTPGKDVKFSISAQRDALTKTLYGAEGTNSIDVNWVSGDLVTIYGTTCAVNQADYSVTPVLSEGGDPTNVAAELNKKGAAGVQWGASEYSDFYAVYPAATGKIQPIPSNDGVIGVEVPASISDTQYNQFTLQGNTWVGVPYDSQNKSLNMKNALMYAYNIGTDGAGVTNGSSSVPLVFQPFSTVLKFSISSWEGISSDGNEFKPNDTDAIILRSIKLTAPNNTYAIAGNFNLELQKKQQSNGTLDVVADVVGVPIKENGNTITVVPTTQVEWKYGTSIEFSVFTIPVAGRDLAKETWAVTIDTSEGVKTLELTPNVENLPLRAGSIHKMSLPGIQVKTTWTYSEKDWITNVPRNIYLSELSVPGAWSCAVGSNGDVSASEQYQQNATIKDLYDAGVRAFHIDCRLSPERLFLGNARGDNRLVVAGTEILTLGSYTNSGTEVLDVLQSISNEIGKGEYAVAVLTIAESRLDDKYGSVEPLEVLAAIKGILNTDNITNLYTSKIDANTTVHDVLNKLIVKINVNTNDINFVGKTDLPSYALISEGSLATSDGSNGSLIKKGVFTKMNSSPIYWSANTTSDLTYYYHQAQGTAGTNQPTYAERKAAIDSIVLRSQRVYSANKHNAWYQIAIGGYQKSSGDKASLVAKELNPYLRLWIEKKMKKETVTVTTADGKTETIVLDCSPLGIVLMNFANQEVGSDYQSYELIKDIIDMNGKFYLSRNPDQEPWPSE